MKKVIGILAAVLLIFVCLNGLLLYKLQAADAKKVFLSTQVFVMVQPASHNLSFFIDASCNQSYVKPLYFTGIEQGTEQSFNYYIRNDSLVPVSVNTSLTPVDWAYIYMVPSTEFTIQPGAVFKATLNVNVKLEALVGQRGPFLLEFYEN